MFQLLYVQVGIFNFDGYYNALMLALFYNGIVEGFIKPSARQIVVLALTAKELMVNIEIKMIHKH